MRRHDGPGNAARRRPRSTVKPSRRDAYQLRTSNAPMVADDRPGDNVARVMRGHHHAADRDCDGIDPHDGARPRPDRADRDGSGERRGGVAGRKAGVIRPPHEQQRGPGILAPTNGRPRPISRLTMATNSPGNAMARKMKPSGTRSRQARCAKSVAATDGHRRNREQQRADRIEEPAGLAELGDVLEKPDPEVGNCRAPATERASSTTTAARRQDRHQRAKRQPPMRRPGRLAAGRPRRDGRT